MTTELEDMYIIRKYWSDPDSELGRYANQYTAVQNCPDGYKIFDMDGGTVFPFNENTYKIKIDKIKEIFKKIEED